MQTQRHCTAWLRRCLTMFEFLLQLLHDDGGGALRCIRRSSMYICRRYHCEFAVCFRHRRCGRCMEWNARRDGIDAELGKSLCTGGHTCLQIQLLPSLVQLVVRGTLLLHRVQMRSLRPR